MTCGRSHISSQRIRSYYGKISHLSCLKLFLGIFFDLFMAGGFAIQSLGRLSTVSLRERCIPQPLNRLGPSRRMCFLRLITFLRPIVNKNILQLFPLSRQFISFLRASAKKPGYLSLNHRITRLEETFKVIKSYLLSCS